MTRRCSSGLTVNLCTNPVGFIYTSTSPPLPSEDTRTPLDRSAQQAKQTACQTDSFEVQFMVHSAETILVNKRMCKNLTCSCSDTNCLLWKKNIHQYQISCECVTFFKHEKCGQKSIWQLAALRILLAFLAHENLALKQNSGLTGLHAVQ